MCYVVVKNKDKHGCCALKTEHSKKLIDLKRRLEETVKQNTQVVLISRPSAYGEYAPYSFAETESELLEVAKEI